MMRAVVMRPVVMGTVLAGIAALALLAGCAPVPSDAWRLEPVRYDNRMDDETGPERPIDVTYPMRLVSDTAGGVWGESTGSWLHLDADGSPVRRFNLDSGLDAPRPVNGLAALTPERLLVSAPADGASGGIHLFDTAAGSWQLLYSEQGLLGDLAVHDGAVYVVAFATGEGTFTVRRLDLESDAVGDPIDVTPPLPWPGAAAPIESSVAIDVGPDGTLHIATQTERIVVDADGVVQERSAQQSRVPQVAAGSDGTVVWSGGSGTSTPVPSQVEGGSADARAVLSRQDCDADTLVVGPGTGTAGMTLPFLCAPGGIAWLSPETFLVSIGGESGAVLVRVTAPAA